MGLYILIDGYEPFDVSEASYKAFKNLIQDFINAGYENYTIVRGDM